MISMGLLTYTFVGICSSFVAVGRIVSGGYRIPLFNGFYVRRWVQPTKQKQCDKIKRQLQYVCWDSIGSLLPHPALHENTTELSNKIILILYDKQNKPAMFNMMLIPDKTTKIKYKLFHFGLVMVRSEYRGRKFKNLKDLNMVLMMFTQPLWMRHCYVTSIGDSPTVARAMPTVLENVYPNYLHPQKVPISDYKNVFDHILEKHRKDLGVSSKGEPNWDTFVIKDSNEPAGGGSSALVPYSSSRRSSDRDVNTFFYSHIKPGSYDEMFFVGTLTPLKAVKNVCHIWSLVQKIHWTSLSNKDYCVRIYEH